MLLIAERDGGSRFGLSEIFLSVGDDTMVRIIAEEVTHPKITTKSPAAARLARKLLDRQLLHRAYAFRARFIATPPGLESEVADPIRNEQWRRLLKSMDTLTDRYSIGDAIYALALQAADALEAAGIDAAARANYKAALSAVGPEQIIVDLPRRKADAIRIMARCPDGTLKVPEFSFNPVKWADAYDLQKRTGYVFCPREVVPLIALSASVIFLDRYGVVMSPDADGYIKAGGSIDHRWIEGLVSARVLDRAAADQIETRRYSLLPIRLEDLRVPGAWLQENPDFAVVLAARIKQGLRSGLLADGLAAFSQVMEAMFAFLDPWYEGGSVSGKVLHEADLQAKLTSHLRSRSLKVAEGTVAGGGKVDLFVQDTVLIENKYKGTATANPTTAAPAAGAQGRRYAVALLSQIVITVAAVRVGKEAQVAPTN